MSKIAQTSRVLLPNKHNIIITGTNYAVGKTSLIRRFAGNKFMHSYNPTYDFHKYSFTLIKKHLNDEYKLYFDVYDTYTSFDIEDFLPLKNPNIPTTSLIICSKDDITSMRNINIMKKITKQISDHQIVLCNKCDALVDEDVPDGIIPMSIKMNILPFNIYPFSILGYGNAHSQ
jgi:GTPase SAR1 family protein